MTILNQATSATAQRKLLRIGDVALRLLKDTAQDWGVERWRSSRQNAASKVAALSERRLARQHSIYEKNLAKSRIQRRPKALRFQFAA